MKALVLALFLGAAPTTQHIEPVPAPAMTAPVEDEGPKPVNWTDFGKLVNHEQPPIAASLINFALLVLIYWRFGKKPVAEALKNRKSTIASAIENAQRILKEAKQRRKRYTKQLERVEADAKEGREALEVAGRGEAEAIVRGAEEKAQRLKRDATFLLEQEKKQTQLDLVRETVERAAREAEKILSSSVNMDDQERLADEFIAKLSKDYEKGLQLP